MCHACDLKVPEDAVRVLFVCTRSKREREFVTKYVGWISVGKLVDSMLESAGNWMAVANVAASVMKIFSRQHRL